MTLAWRRLGQSPWLFAGPAAAAAIAFVWLPMVSTLALSFPVAAVVWLWLFNPTVGFLNTLTGSLGVPPQRWLSDPDLAIWSVIAVTFWKSFGLNLLIFLAALANVPADVTEAA